MSTFEIVIQRKVGDYYPVVAEFSPSGMFIPIRSEDKLRLTPENVIELTSLLGQSKDYGTCLGKHLFQNEIRSAFDTARNESKEQLRILLFIEAEDIELKSLRWERLCAPMDGGWNFLRRNQRVPYSLYIPSITDRRFPPIGRRDLCALVLVASPQDSEDYNLAHFDVEATVVSIRAALGDKIPCDVLAHGVKGAIGLPTLDNLCKQLTQKSYTLLHFVCHGQLEKGTRETVLYWTTEDNKVDGVKGKRLIDELKNVQEKRLPYFAFLCTCESASKSAEGAFGGFAEQLVRDLGMPAVVAMTENITIKTAETLAEQFYQQLREHGEVDLALDEATAGLGTRQDIIVPALFSRLGGRPLFSDDLDRPLTSLEIRHGLERLQQLLSERAPVLQGEFEQQEVILKRTQGVEVSELSREASQERRGALDEINKLSGEVLDLSFNALALDKEVPGYDNLCPFRGLYPFRLEDQSFFFGREKLIQTLEDKLKETKEQPFLAVLGDSGSGKSSLVLAGLIPALQKEEPALQLAYMTPSSDPLAQLKISLAKVQGQPFVLVVDQFEELFTLCTDKDQRQAFINELLTLIQQPQRVFLTMRADFWGECAPYSKLNELMLKRQELIAPMNSEELRTAMEKQAGKVGLRFEPGLSNTILDAVQGEPGAMPLLQHALQKLWERRHGRWLRYIEYEKFGGIKKAIASTAQDLYNSLPSENEQKQVRHIFEQLVRIDEDFVLSDENDEPKDTRRRVELSQLSTENNNLSLNQTRDLVAKLADARLVITKRDKVTQKDEVEVAHEALILHWPLLKNWLKDSRDRLKIQQQLRPTVKRWQESQDDGELLRGGLLQTVTNYLRDAPDAFSQGEKAFIQASQALPHRKLKLSTVLKTSFAVATMVAVVRILGILQPLEFAVYDQWMRLKPSEEKDERLLLVTVDDQDILEQAKRNEPGTGTVKDPSLEKLLQKLQQYKPRVIGLDLARDFAADKSTRLDLWLKILTKPGVLIGICTSPDGTSTGQGGGYPVALALEQVKDSVGFSNFLARDNNNNRLQPLLNPILEEKFCPTEQSFSFAIARRYLDKEEKAKPYSPPAIQQEHYASDLQFAKTVIKRRTGLAGGYQGDLSEQNTYQIFLNYRLNNKDPKNFAERVNLRDVLNDKLSEKQVKGKIVIIGIDSELSAPDIVFTPFGKMSGPIVQAQMVSQVVSAVLDNRPLIWWWPVWADVLWIAVWSSVGGLIVWQFRQPLQWVIGAAVLTSLVGICWVVFAYQTGWIPLAPPVIALVGTAGVIAFITFRLRQGGSRKIKGVKRPGLIAIGNLTKRFPNRTS